MTTSQIFPALAGSSRLASSFCLAPGRHSLPLRAKPRLPEPDVPGRNRITACPPRVTILSTLVPRPT